MKIFKITEKQRQNLFVKFPFQKQLKQHNTFYWHGSEWGITMHFYFTSYKLLIQGSEKNLTIFFKNNYLLFPNEQTLNLEMSNNTLEEKDKIPYFGGDESGVGDLFGPIVLTVVYLDLAFLKVIQNLPIQDSKQLTDAEVKLLAPKLMEYKSNFFFEIVDNNKFNLQFGNSMNLKELITFYYVKILQRTVHLKDSKQIIIDGYTTSRLFTKYCLRLNLGSAFSVNFVEKAENKHLAVGAASIISRFLFLQEMDKISQYFQRPILLGANPKVKILVQELSHQYGWDILQRFVKLNYKGVKN